MKPGFEMKELMKGWHHFTHPAFGSPEERLLYFNITWGQDFREFLNPSNPSFFTARAEGEIFVEGLTKDPVETRGSLNLSYLERTELRYDLAFEVEEKKYVFVGRKRNVKLWKPWMLPKTHTTCYGLIEDEEYKVISRSVVHFPMDAKGILDFLGSFRVFT